MAYKIGQLIIAPGQKSNKKCEIFVSQPDLEKERLAGVVFALFDISNKSIDALKLIDFIINSFNSHYYHNDKILLREKVSSIKIENIFESGLAKLNKELAELFENEKPKISLSDLNITLGVVFENFLHFSTIGDNRCLLIHPNTDDKKEDKNPKKRRLPISGDPRPAFKITDVGKAANDEKTDIKKLFSNIISGKMPSGGYFVFASESLTEYLSLKKIMEIATTLPPSGAAEQMKAILKSINAYVPFASIVIKNTFGAESQKNIKSAVRPTPLSRNDSIVTLNATEDATEKLLAPSGVINLKKFFNAPLWLARFLGIKGRRSSSALAARDIASYRSGNALFPFKKITRILGRLQKAFIYLAAVLYYSVKFLANKNGLKALARSVILFPLTLSNRIVAAGLAIGRLSIKNKILLTVVFLVFAALFGSIAFKTKNNQKTELAARQKEVAAEIEQKQNAIDADLLYNNKAQAQKTLGEIESIIGELPDETDEQKSQRQAFYEKFYEQIEKIRNVANVAAPEKFADLNSFEPGALPENLALDETAGKLVSLDAANKKIFIIDIRDNSVSATSSRLLDGAGQIYGFTAGIDDETIFYLAESGAIGFNPSESVFSFTAFLNPPQAAGIAASAGYNNKYYLAVKEKNQISLFNKGQSGFSYSQDWLKEKIDIREAVSMDIDGFIYLLFADGRIVKMSKGGISDFKQDPVDPAPKKATKISAPDESQFLYVLEPDANRLMVFKKTGSFVLQYLAGTLKSMKDFAVDEKMKKIYILDGSAVYMFPTKHL